MKSVLFLLLFAVTVLVSATNGHPSRGTKTFLARLNQNLNKVCAKVNSLEQEVGALSAQEDQVTQLGDAVRDLTQQVIEQGNLINEQGKTISEQGNTINELGNTINEQDNTISVLEQRIEDLEGQNTPDPTVAFTAVLHATSQVVSSASNILYETVITNVGGGYNVTTGEFMVMHSGLYQFSASVVKSYSGEGGIPLTFSIMRNGVQEIAGIYADNLGNNDQGAATTLIHLDAGTKVSVRNTGDSNTVTGQGDTMFSGYLIQAGEGPVDL